MQNFKNNYSDLRLLAGEDIIFTDGDFEFILKPVSVKDALLNSEIMWLVNILDQEIDIALSTRENREFRDNMLKLGITTMSAGSSTNPGGYSEKSDSLKQFEIDDNRTPREIKNMIIEKGYEPVWKNWDKFMQI